MGSEARVLASGVAGKEGEQLGRPVHGLHGGDAQAWQGGLFEQGADEVGKGAASVRCGVKVAAPAPKVDAGENQFLPAAGCERLRGGEGLAERNGAAGAAGFWNDAEGAAVAAAVLHFEHGPRAGVSADREGEEEGVGVLCGKGGMCVGGVEKPGKGDEAFGWLRGEGADCFCGDAGFVAVAEDGVDAGEGSQCFRVSLGVAAGDEDAGGGLLAVGAPNEGARSALGLGGDGAGVDDEDWEVCGLAGLRGSRSGGQRGELRFELGGDGLAVCCAGAAAKVLDGDGGHALIVDGG